MQQRLRRAALDQRGNCGKVVDRADFVIHMHDGDQRGVLRELFFQLGEIDRAVRVETHKHDFDFAIAFERAEHLVDRRMLSRGGEDALFPAQGLERAQNRHVVGLRAAGGIQYLGGRAGERAG